MSLFITDAFAAATASPAANGNPFGSIFMLVGFIAIFYFMLWRPQSKRAKDHRDLITNLAQGDEVVTNGGMLGRIVKMSDGFILMNIAEGIDIKVQKPSISATLPKGTIKSI